MEHSLQTSQVFQPTYVYNKAGLGVPEKVENSLN